MAKRRAIGRALTGFVDAFMPAWQGYPQRQKLLLENEALRREQEAAQNYQELLSQIGSPGATSAPQLPEQVVAPPPELPTTVRRRELPEQVGAPPPVAPFRVTPQSLRDTAARMKPEERVGSGVLTDTPPDPRGGLTLSDRMAYDLMRTPRELPPLSQGAAPSVGSGPVPVTPPTTEWPELITPRLGSGRSHPMTVAGRSGYFDFDQPAVPAGEGTPGARHVFKVDDGDVFTYQLERAYQGNRWEDSDHAREDYEQYKTMPPQVIQGLMREKWNNDPIGDVIAQSVVEGAPFEILKERLAPYNTHRQISQREEPPALEPVPPPVGWTAAPTAPARPPTAPAAVAPAPAPAPPRYDAEKTLYTPPSEPGQQWSPEVLQLRRLGRQAGFDQAQIDADLASVKPLPQWTEYQQARALAEQAAAPGAFTEAEVMDQYGSPTKEYYNSVIRQNPWLFDWMSTQGEYAPRMDTLFPWISKYREGHQPELGQDIDDDKLLTGKDMERLIDFTRFYPGDVDETTGVPAKLRRTELADEAVSTLATLPNIVQNVEEMFNMAEELNKGNTSRFMGLFSSRFDRILAAFGNLDAENRAREAGGFSGMMQFVIDNATTDESIDSAMQETLDEYNRGGNTPLTPEEVGNISDYVRGLLSLRMGLAGPIARSVTGEVGVLTDADVQRAQQLLPQMGETAGQTAQKKNTIYRNMLGMFNSAYFGPMHGAQQVWDILNSPPTQSLSTGSGGSIEENFIPVK